jgi:DNA-binding transcriptional LysR family regulator
VIFLDLRQLETFIEVANLKSFSKAADKLYITQPTVTNHIQNLEKEMKTSLINRSGKNISLTPSGTILYEYAINIINSCKMAKFKLESFKGKIQGHLDIFSSTIPSKYVLPNIVYNFLLTYPDVTFSLISKDSKSIIKSILEGQSDFGIIGTRHCTNQLEYIDLMEDNLFLITPNIKRFSCHNYSTLEKNILLKEKIIMREKGSGVRELVERQMELNFLNLKQLNIIGYVEDTEIIKKLVSLGAGISFLSEISVKDEIQQKKIKIFNIDGFNLNRKFYFVYHKTRHLSPLSEAFKNFTLNYIASNINN